MRTYKAIAGQSLFDVCLQTYGTLDLIYKMMQDNGVNGLNEPVLSGQAFVWDESLVLDQQLSASFAASGKIYATDVSNYGSVFYVVNDTGAIVPNNPSDPYLPPAPSENKYQMVYNTTYKVGADEETVITPLSISGGSLIGFDITQVILEIKPLIPEGQVGQQYVWNKTAGVLTLVNGTVAYKDQIISILYSKIEN